MTEIYTKADVFLLFITENNQCLAWDKKGNSTNTENRHENELTCVKQIFFHFEL